MTILNSNLPSHQDIVAKNSALPSHSSILDTLKEWGNNIIHGNTVTYERPQAQTPVDFGAKTAPFKDSILKSGQTFKAAEDFAKQKGFDVPRGILPSLYIQESSAGQNKASYNKKIGEHAYKYGLTLEAKKELEKNGIEADFNSEQGAANAAAAYWGIRSQIKKYDKTSNSTTTDEEAMKAYQNNEGKRYVDRWNGGGVAKWGKNKVKEVEDNFNSIYNEVKSVDYYTN